MPTIAVLEKIDGERLLDSLNGVLAKLDGAEEVTLDFSEVKRVPPAGLQILEKLATTSQEKSAKVFLRGVNIDVYKVLKLARLSGRFGFLS